MDALPVEIIELIFSVCDAKVLAIQIPQVSKLFKKLSEDDSNLWKAKCEQKYLSSNSKPSDQTYKQYYFPDVLKLFPFNGFILTKSTRQEILDAPSALSRFQGDTEYITLHSNNYWLSKDGIFDMLYLVVGDELPYQWETQGISWEISWIELKELLSKKVGNYNVTGDPHQKLFQGKNCFSASITTAVKEEHDDSSIYYDLEFTFDYERGDETTAGTLYRMSIQGHYGEDNWVKYLYEERECKE